MIESHARKGMAFSLYLLCSYKTFIIFVKPYETNSGKSKNGNKLNI